MGKIYKFYREFQKPEIAFYTMSCNQKVLFWNEYVGDWKVSIAFDNLLELIESLGIGETISVISEEDFKKYIIVGELER